MAHLYADENFKYAVVERLRAFGHDVLTVQELAWLFLLGPAMFIAGFCFDILFAGIPYQDPPPELQASYLLHSTIAGYLECSGLLWFAGVVTVWIGYKCLRR